jgi:hypothetical protein
MACQDLHGSTRRWYRVWKMEEFLSKLEKMETKTGYIDPRFAVRANASIDLQLRETTEIKDNDERVGDGEAAQKERRKQTTHSHSCLWRAAAAGHQRTDSANPAGHQRTDSAITAGHPVTYNGFFNFQPVTENGFCIPSGHQRMDSAGLDQSSNQHRSHSGGSSQAHRVT